MFFIAILAETNRPPLDLSEAESELVAGFLTEYSGSVFVFFFLGEYSSLILMSTFMAIFFLGGHHCPDLHKLIIDPFIFIYNYIVKFDISFNLYMYSQLINQGDFIDLSSSSLRAGDVLLFPALRAGNDLSEMPQEIFTKIININSQSMTIFTAKDTIFQSINILIDKIYGSYILGVKIIIVIFFFI